MFQISICDDNTAFAHIFEKQLKQAAQNLNIALNISLYSNGEQLLRDFNRKQFDIIYLDIEFASQANGIVIAEQIRNVIENHQTEIVFISSHTQYYAELFSVQPLDFINKSTYNIKQLEQILNVYQKRHPHNSYFSFVYEGRKHTVPYENILYFQFQNKRECLIQLVDTAYTIILKQSFRHFADSIVLHNFIKINQSCCINPLWIDTVSYYDIRFKNGDMKTIAHSHYKDFRQNYLKGDLYGYPSISNR